jgi:hypothetical protein
MKTDIRRGRRGVYVDLLHVPGYPPQVMPTGQAWQEDRARGVRVNVIRYPRPMTLGL